MSATHFIHHYTNGIPVLWPTDPAEQQRVGDIFREPLLARAAGTAGREDAAGELFATTVEPAVEQVEIDSVSTLPS